MEKAEKTLGIIVGCAAIVVVICLLLSYFGVFNRMFTAAKVDGQRISVAQMNCAFADVKNQTYNASQQYEESNGSGFYTSDTKLTDSCVYDSSLTWGEYFQEQALDHVKQVTYYKDKDGSTLTEDQQKEISETLSTLAESAKSNNFSLNAYIREVYGVGVNKKVLRTWLEDFYKAQNALKAVKDNYAAQISDKDIKAYYEEHKEDYTEAEIMFYTISVDTSSVQDKLSKSDLTNDEVDKIVKDVVASTKKSATELYNNVKASPDSFRNLVNAYEKKTKGDSAVSRLEGEMTVKGAISSRMTSLGSEGQKWVANSTKAKQVGLVYTPNYDSKTFQFDLIVVKSPAKDFSTINVRHILIQPSDTESDDSWKEAKEQIDEIYAQWKKNPTEENFTELATEKTSDTGSKDNGGLYENVTPGQMVDTFNDWCFDASRKEGDTGIVKTSYGYHLMYFVSNNGIYWKTAIPDDMASKQQEDSLSSLEDVEAVKVDFCWSMIKDVKDYKSAQKTTTTTTTEAETTTAAAAE